MSRLARRGVPVVYYVTPQLWAWRPKRMKTMQRHVTLALPIFPFEEALYQQAGVPVRFLGPSARGRRAGGAGRSGRGRRGAARRCAARSGSTRRGRSWRCCRAAATTSWRGSCRSIAAALPLIPAARAGGAVRRGPRARPPRRRVRAARRGVARRCRSCTDRTDDVLAAADVVVTASGTATAQAALHERPMVVIYKLSPLTYALGKPLVTIDTYAMANLVAGERDRARADPGGVHARGRGRRDGVVPARSRALGAHARAAGRDARQARPARDRRRAWPTAVLEVADRGAPERHRHVTLAGGPPTAG